MPTKKAPITDQPLSAKIAAAVALAETDLAKAEALVIDLASQRDEARIAADADASEALTTQYRAAKAEHADLAAQLCSLQERLAQAQEDEATAAKAEELATLDAAMRSAMAQRDAALAGGRQLLNQALATLAKSWGNSDIKDMLARSPLSALVSLPPQERGTDYGSATRRAHRALVDAGGQPWHPATLAGLNLLRIAKEL